MRLCSPKIWRNKAKKTTFYILTLQTLHYLRE
nr:MAG TPA: hypothetical protein [Caudoviricetes sp.]